MRHLIRRFACDLEPEMLMNFNKENFEGNRKNKEIKKGTSNDERQKATKSLSFVPFPKTSKREFFAFVILDWVGLRTIVICFNLSHRPDGE